MTRYVAEGVARLDDLLVVTFGRAASQELRERVRAQLVAAERALDGDPAATGAPGAGDDLLLALLLDCDEAERSRRHARVVAALTGLRRGDDRDHAPVLLAGARLARRGR